MAPTKRITHTSAHALPPLLYAFGFALLAPAALRDSLTPGRILGDGYDAAQHLWNLWWIKKSLVELHISPWTCKWLFHPFGADLHGHSLNLLGSSAIFLIPASLARESAYNLILIATFPLSGWGAYALARREGAAWFPAFAAGWFYAFSSYRWSHAEGHMNLLMTMWLPIFLASWRSLLEKPSACSGLFAALTLAASLWSDPLYFIYSIIAAAILLGSLFVGRACSPTSIPTSNSPSTTETPNSNLNLNLSLNLNPAPTPTTNPRSPFLRDLPAATLWGWSLFVVLALIACAPLVLSYLTAANKLQFIGGHPPRSYSLDLIAPFIPGPHSRWGWMTHRIWERFPAGPIEGNIYLGWCFIILAALGFAKRGSRMRPWAVLSALFFLLALGPRIQVRGQSFESIPLPYALLECLVPKMKLSGVPIRMMVVAQLALIPPVAAGIAYLLSTRTRWLAPLILLLAAIELVPLPLASAPFEVPTYCAWLRDQPGTCPVIDTVNLPLQAMAGQTIHGKPIAFGYLSKRQRLGLREDGFLHLYINWYLNTGRSPFLLQYYRFRFIVVTADTIIPDLDESQSIAWRDEFTKIIDLEAQQRIAPEVMP